MSAGFRYFTVHDLTDDGDGTFEVRAKTRPPMACGPYFGARSAAENHARKLDRWVKRLASTPVQEGDQS